MKNLLALFVFGILPICMFGQIPQAFNYQAVVRDSDGKIQFDTTADFEIEILQSGNPVYTENHFGKETGKTGVVNFKVGMGTNVTGNFSQIDWSLGQFQIRITLNGEKMGMADIVAVPFALYAQKSHDDGDWTKVDSSKTLYYMQIRPYLILSVIVLPGGTLTSFLPWLLFLQSFH